MRKLVLFVLLSLFFVSNQSVTAQTPTPSPAPALSGIKANLAAGEVSTVSQGDNKILLKTSDGDIEVMLAETTAFKKVSPEKPDLKTATETNLEEIGVADKILVSGKVSDDKKTIAAKTVYLMTKSDISKKIAAEREAWRTRGISGRVEMVDFKTKTITVVTRSLTGETKIALTPKDEVSYKRYAPDSVKFADAKDSNLAEVKVGDQLRALGDKSADGLTFKAEQIVTGAFKTVAGKVTAIDVAKNEITIEDAGTKKPVTIVVNNNSMLKKMPPEIAQMMAIRMAGGGGQGGTTFTMGGGQGNIQMRPPQGGQGQTPSAGGQTPPANNQATPPNGQNPPNGGQGGPGGGQRQFMMRGGGGGLDDMFNNFPTLPLAELKIGDTIGVTSTAGTVANRYTAIKLLSGVEPFLNMPRMQTAGGGRGGNQDFNIPGLDGGFGNP
jgi:hypothetical protein